LRLTQSELWQLGAEARAQLRPREPKLDLTLLCSGARRLRINGFDLETRWETLPQVLDERGHPVLGAIEYDAELARIAQVSLNSAELQEREDLTLSTAAHELAHAVFDAPAWMLKAERPGAGQVRYRTVVRRFRVRTGFDPSEWRANEFMGSFLAPPKMLRHHMTKVLVELGLPRAFDQKGAPVLDTATSGPHELQCVADELAMRFGLSIAFIEYRLHKYGFAPVRAA
jgi:hypothetical protein